MLPIGSLPRTAPVPKPRRIKSPQPQPKVRPRTCVNQTPEKTPQASHRMKMNWKMEKIWWSALYPADRPPEDKPTEDVESEDQNTEVDGRDETVDEQREQPTEEPPVPPVDVPPDEEIVAAPVPPNPQPSRSVRERRPQKG
ncbi:protein TsetseEP-like [Haliotis rufescens]|uniref:protein TsetseEP-like n=1 Tax=Haliotis rufescens TaxID=6454 RepID=UPI00201F30C0|nr:protein TsetseEP-like [Haliotis rufescens]